MNNLIKKIILFKKLDERYVYLRKDDKGYYIEWAFKEGVPHDNRCLSWYTQGDPIPDNPVPKRYYTNYKPKEVDKIYRLNQYTCGRENNKGKYRCIPGHPKEKCPAICSDWTYERPIKCACWDLVEVDFDFLRFSFTANELEKFIENI